MSKRIHSASFHPWGHKWLGWCYEPGCNWSLDSDSYEEVVKAVVKHRELRCISDADEQDAEEDSRAV